LVDLFC